MMMLIIIGIITINYVSSNETIVVNEFIGLPKSLNLLGPHRRAYLARQPFGGHHHRDRRGVLHCDRGLRHAAGG